MTADVVYPWNSKKPMWVGPSGQGQGWVGGGGEGRGEGGHWKQVRKAGSSCPSDYPGPPQS